ncbi:Hint domain-containing protein [Acidisoma cellulosilytica]|uniref:Hint domain-containing protein n=1 Tax=Acidisoma cellulosilyticum TaxID=2802395 RepID=A0A963Z774_9PROT|nr:Hint domain-containing protein [Acidisoma cellulosilyticum]MCB8883103.1 Hint domain-containing protein [Acidisoma cellulosilyticum]
MSDVTISGASAPAIFETDEAAPYAQTLAAALNSGLDSGTLTALPYTSGPVAPAAAGGVVVITTTPATTLAIPTTDVGLFITGGATSVTGGGVGETVIGGSGGLTYTDITPSGSVVDYIAVGDGNNLITTGTTGIGNYQINTGAGNDTISVFGNAVINAGTGQNTISVSGGNSYIYSEGGDNITMSGTGTDTVNIGTGQTTINPGSTNLFVFGSTDATKPIFIGRGTGSDTISVGSGGGTVYAGTGGNSVLFGGTGAATTGAVTALHGSTNGDQLYAIGAAPVVLYAGGGDETLSGAGGTVDGLAVPESTADNTFMAGSGNDTIVGGAGNDVIIASTGRGAFASGTGKTTFAFVNGEAGGQDTITGFASNDRLVFNGYGVAQFPTEVVGGSEIIELPDATEITLQGITSLSPSQIFYDAPLCFLQGTLIGTAQGLKAVEQLAIGDLVSTTTAGEQPIRWIGICSVSTRFADPLRVMPIRIKAGALAENIPERDLLVSPDHAILVDGVLIQAGALVNGLSVTQERSMPERFTYYHIELAEHSLILAEGAPAETFVDNVDRMSFDNWAEHQALYGLDIPIIEMAFPRAQSRRQIPKGISNRLMKRAVEKVETGLKLAV